MSPAIVVVGGGISGLACAWELVTGAANGAMEEPAAVTVLDSADRLGGKLMAAEVDGWSVDVGPDGFLSRRSEAVELCSELGMEGDLVPIGASGASVWARGRRRALPEGHVLGVPTRLRPVARSGILGPAGMLRLTLDVVAPRPDRRGPLGDRAIGPLVARKLGRKVVERLVDPLVGGIHASGVADASAAALFPALLEGAGRGGSLVRAMRRGAREAGRAKDAEPGPPRGPAFLSLRDGLTSLTARLAAELEARGATLSPSVSATALRRAGERWQVVTDAGVLEADGVVLAVPAFDAAELLEPLDADAAASLRSVAYASVGVITFAFDAACVPDLPGTGLLVPRATPFPAASGADGGGADGGGADGGGPKAEPFMVTACTYLWAKWPDRTSEDVRLVRASVGRLGDDRWAHLDDGALVERATAELRTLCGIEGEPRAAVVTRWPNALPEYRVHHLLRVASVEGRLGRLGHLALAGAAYHGVGIPACIASGRNAARELTAELQGKESPQTA